MFSDKIVVYETVGESRDILPCHSALMIKLFVTMAIYSVLLGSVSFHYSSLRNREKGT